MAAPRAPVAAPVRAVLGPQPVPARACGPGAGGPAPAPAGSGRQCACAGRARGLGADREGAWRAMPPCAIRRRSGSSSPPTARRCCRRWWASRPPTSCRGAARATSPSIGSSWRGARPSCARRIAEGGLGEAALRALVYVGLAERDERRAHLQHAAADPRRARWQGRSRHLQAGPARPVPDAAARSASERWRPCRGCWRTPRPPRSGRCSRTYDGWSPPAAP